MANGEHQEHESLGAETGGLLVYARPCGRHVITTYYTRGAVVKLASSHAEKARHKIVIVQSRGRYGVQAPTYVKGRQVLGLVADFSTLDLAVEYAERECERIRLTLLGGEGATDPTV